MCVLCPTAEPNWWLEIVRIVPSAIVALIVGVGGLYIAVGQRKISASQRDIAAQQKEVAHAKLNLDLFETRYELFLEVWGFLSSGITTGPKGPTAPKFTNLIPRARFLFGDEIAEYMNEASSKMSRLWMMDESTRRNGQVMPPEHAMDYSQIQTWFAEEASKGCYQRFAPYLNFSSIRSPEL